jgi:hypothetical protein
MPLTNFQGSIWIQDKREWGIISLMHSARVKIVLDWYQIVSRNPHLSCVIHSIICSIDGQIIFTCCSCFPRNFMPTHVWRFLLDSSPPTTHTHTLVSTLWELSSTFRFTPNNCTLPIPRLFIYDRAGVCCVQDSHTCVGIKFLGKQEQHERLYLTGCKYLCICSSE